MVDRESETGSDAADDTGRLVASLREDDVSSPAGLCERVGARIRSELLRRDLLELFGAAPARRDLLELFSGAPVRLVRQLLRRGAPPRRER